MCVALHKNELSTAVNQMVCIATWHAFSNVMFIFVAGSAAQTGAKVRGQMQPPGGGAPLCSSRRPAGITFADISSGSFYMQDMATLSPSIAASCLQIVPRSATCRHYCRRQGLPWGAMGINTPHQ